MLGSGNAGFGGNLEFKKIAAQKPHKVRSIKLPGIGRVAFTRDPGTGSFLSSHNLGTRLTAVHRDGDGKFIDQYDFGSGNIQTNLVVGLLWDSFISSSTPANYGSPVFQNRSKFMYSGTGSTVNDYDYTLGAAINIASATNSETYGFGASSGAPASQLQFIGTITYTGTNTVAEWGLFNNNSNPGAAVSTSTVNTASATGVTGATWTVAPPIVNTGWASYICVATAASPIVGGYILSNSTNTTGSNIVIGGAVGSGASNIGWYNLNSNTTLAAGSTPGVNVSLSIYPLMFDHKALSPTVGVNNGDSIQFTYTLSIVAGG